ncbi:2,3-diaminopropionate biosynthesis protein SbnA [Vallitalea sediminicola]
MKKYLEQVGNTPVINLSDKMFHDLNIYIKLEFFNPTGSVKDRAASFILNKLISNGEIDKDTIIIESSSGNFGIALASYCKMLGLKFYCVIDPNITYINEMLIRKLSTEVFIVKEHDENGGYLIERIKKVKRLQAQHENTYWINQYGNPYNAEAYYMTLGNELCNEINPIDYIFIGVSSCGTITGVSQRIKGKFPKARVIAVDIVGSVIFGGKSKKRYIPGIGSSMQPENLRKARIDDVIQVTEEETIDMCNYLLENHQIFAGGSSGSVMVAIHNYFRDRKLTNVNVVAIFADRGDRYGTTVYNKEWCMEKFPKMIKGERV